MEPLPSSSQPSVPRDDAAAPAAVDAVGALPVTRWWQWWPLRPVWRLGRGSLSLAFAVSASVGIVVLAVAAWLYWDNEARQQASLLLGQLYGAQVATPQERVLQNFQPIVQFNRAEALLPPQQLVAQQIARRFRIGRQPAEEIVRQAVKAGQALGLDPYLILAVAAVESRFNPFAQSSFGAQGLMQILPRFHQEAFLAAAGEINPFDPAGSIRVGAVILSQYRRANGGSLERALAQYLGAVESDPGNYLDTVYRWWAEFSRIAGAPQPTPFSPLKGLSNPAGLSYVPDPEQDPVDIATPAPTPQSP